MVVLCQAHSRLFLSIRDSLKESVQKVPRGDMEVTDRQSSRGRYEQDQMAQFQNRVHDVPSK